MSKSMNMLRTRRRDNNVKPNRRLDRKSSRGMIYENEELRLKTININAEIERGQSDIKKLRRENDMLKKEIWCLRDEYEKLDKLLKDKDFSSTSSTCSSSDTESCSSCSEETEVVETSQNAENVQKTNIKNLHTEFDHLSVVAEENSAENSTENSNRTSSTPNENVIQPDQSYPNYPSATNQMPKNFFAPLINNKPLKAKPNYDYYNQTTYLPYYGEEVLPALAKTASDIIVKMDNQSFVADDGGFLAEDNFNTLTRSSFSNGGNLEELLHDIETISQDILHISSSSNQDNAANAAQEDFYKNQEPYKSELQVVLMPTPMPLIGFEKYRNLASQESLQRSLEMLSVSNQNLAILTEDAIGPDHFYGTPTFLTPEIHLQECPSEIVPLTPILLELPQATEIVSFENQENLQDFDLKQKSPKLSIRRKVSIHFKGKKEKCKNPEIILAPPQPNQQNQTNQPNQQKRLSLFEKLTDTKISHKKTPSLESKKSIDLSDTKLPSVDTKPKHSSQEAKSSSSDRNSAILVDKKVRKSVSISPDRKHVTMKDDGLKKGHKKGHKKAEKLKQRRSTISTDRVNRERSFSVCTTDKSNILDPKFGFSSNYSMCDEYMSDTNSMSSCNGGGSDKMRKMSNISNFPMTGKIPWCGCWGNGCL